MAPEIKNGELYGLSVDVYSLGVIYYRLLTVRLPVFVNDQIQFSGDKLSVSTRYLLGGMLDKNPDKRPKTVEV